jgi:hypothetical protein
VTPPIDAGQYVAPAPRGIRGKPDVDPRDIEALRDLVRFGVMADDQLARRYAPAADVFTRLPHLKETGIVHRWWESLEGARIYSPTRLARLIARVPNLRPRTTHVTHLAHDVALVDLADYLISQDPSSCWFAEDEVRGYLDQIAPTPRRPRGDTRHRPDGLLVANGGRIAIELEHSDKYQTRYARISAWFVREWRIDRVRWYVDNPRTLERLRDVNQRHGFDRDMKIELEPLPPSVRVRQRQSRFEA